MFLVILGYYEVLNTVTKDQFRLSFFYNRSDIYLCTT